MAKNGVVYAYCRISTPQQNIERQERNIKAAYPDAVILKDIYTGTKIDGRKEFEKLIKEVKSGDTIVFDSVSVMSRNADDGVEQYESWYKSGVNLVFLKEPYVNTEVYKAASVAIPEVGMEDFKPLFTGLNATLMRLAQRQIRLAFEQAQKEVDDLRQSTKEGIETARLNGKQIGQKRGAKLNVKKEAPMKQKIIELSRAFDGKYKDSEVIELLKISQPTYYKYKREIKEAMEDAESDGVDHLMDMMLAAKQQIIPRKALYNEQ